MGFAMFASLLILPGAPLDRQILHRGEWFAPASHMLYRFELRRGDLILSEDTYIKMVGGGKNDRRSGWYLMRWARDGELDGSYSAYRMSPLEIRGYWVNPQGGRCEERYVRTTKTD